MNFLNVSEIQLIMACGTFLLGGITFLVGIFILVSGTMRRDLNVLATQTTRLAQKGLAEEVAGLVGNASSLLNAVNELVRTAAGIGVFLIFIGMILVASSLWIIFQIS